LLRFLRATKYDVQESVGMVRKMLKWRAENSIDAIRDDIVKNNMAQSDLPGYKEFTSYLPIKPFWGVDKEGNPVCRDTLGSFDPEGADRALGEAGITKFWLYLLEFRMILLDRLSREQRKMILVYEIKDLDRVTIGMMWSCKPLITRLAKYATEYYVETTRRVAVINLPGIFSMLYTAAKPFIPARSLAKIKVVDDDDQAAIEAKMSTDMTIDNFNATEPSFDARPRPPIELAEGEFATPPETPPELDDMTSIDPAEFRKALLQLGVIEQLGSLHASK